VAKYEESRDKKNNRSRERAMETKKQVDAILLKPEPQRTRREVQFLETHGPRKGRMDEGDRMRRDRIKCLGLKGTRNKKPGISARGPLPPELQGKLDQESGVQQQAPPPANMYPMQYHPPPPHYPGYPPYPPPPPPPPQQQQQQQQHPFSPGGGVGFTIANGRATTTAYPLPEAFPPKHQWHADTLAGSWESEKQPDDTAGLKEEEEEEEEPTAGSGEEAAALV
jgi:hypothetical protein